MGGVVKGERMVAFGICGFYHRGTEAQRFILLPPRSPSFFEGTEEFMTKEITESLDGICGGKNQIDLI